jgi:hypothetical protein
MNNLLYIILIFSPFNTLCQNVSNVNYFVDGNSIVVTYDVRGCESGCNVTLSMRDKEGKEIIAKYLKGESINLINGNSIKTIWSPIEEGIEIKGEYKAIINISHEFEIGATYREGIIAYIYEPGDLGYVYGEKHGIIVSKKDLGLMNWDQAKKMCSLKGRGWILPSEYELGKIYNNRNSIGGFSNSYYWSSSEYGNDDAWFYNFESGIAGNNCNKNKLNYVRAIQFF